jgi:hypothetical protein
MQIMPVMQAFSPAAFNKADHRDSRELIACHNVARLLCIA